MNASLRKQRNRQKDRLDRLCRPEQASTDLAELPTPRCHLDTNRPPLRQAIAIPTRPLLILLVRPSPMHQWLPCTIQLSMATTTRAPRIRLRTTRPRVIMRLLVDICTSPTALHILAHTTLRRWDHTRTSAQVIPTTNTTHLPRRSTMLTGMKTVADPHHTDRCSPTSTLLPMAIRAHSQQARYAIRRWPRLIRSARRSQVALTDDRPRLTDHCYHHWGP